jgi:hypothetical protein
VTVTEILHAWRARDITYPEAYQRLALAGVRDPRAWLADVRTSSRQAVGWQAVHEAAPVGWLR